MAEKSENIPTLADLARQYGTITEEQYTHLNRLYPLLAKGEKHTDHEALLLGQKMATSYQIGLLKLIRDYHIIRRKGEEFGKIAVKKGFATPADIKRALEIQKRKFKESRLKKLMGDILVADGVITTRQKTQILKEQTLFDKKSKDILEIKSRGTGLDLSGYEKKFLRIKALDEEFSAAVLEKGLASEQEVARAKEIQEQTFENKKPIKIIGDIMVDLNFITREQKNIILEEQGRTEEIKEKDSKPIFCLTAATDGMSAWVELYEGPADLKAIKSFLHSEKILKGIYPDTLLQCCLDQGLKKIAVARKDYSSQLREDRNLKIDLYKNLTEKGEKRKGDLLATQGPVKTTRQKENIYGKKSAAHSTLDFTVRCGIGTRMSRDKTGLIASKTGVPALSVDRFLFVHPIVHVLEDADQRYGPLEPYANLTVSGIITGAHPVRAGHVKAREIRGATITAIGNVRTDVGITDAVIRAQGDIHARYLHNCRIETFGSVYVKNEIFDSDIRCSGSIESPNCRVISSEIHAKQGIILAGTGSEKTRPCKITAGGDQHILAVKIAFLQKIDNASKALNDLAAEKDEEEIQAKRAFQKMVELKIFHDRAKKKKEGLASEFKKNRSGLDRAQLKNILKLISNFETRMTNAITRLKTFNKAKKEHDLALATLKRKIQKLKPKTKREINDLEQSLFACLEWSRSEKSLPRIDINGKAFQGTRLGGAYSDMTLDRHMEHFWVEEIPAEKNQSPFMKMVQVSGAGGKRSEDPKEV